MVKSFISSDQSFQVLFITSLVIIFLVLLVLIFLIAFLFNFVVKQNKKINNENESYEKKLLRFGESLTNTLDRLSFEKIGALIVIEKKDDISFFKNNGYIIKGKFSPEFIISIFSNKKSALHDGAILISNFDIFAISSYLPMTKNTLDVKYGARHRAAVGMSEMNDSIIFVVSETSGRISFAHKGILKQLPVKHNQLRIEIQRLLEKK